MNLRLAPLHYDLPREITGNFMIFPIGYQLGKARTEREYNANDPLTESENGAVLRPLPVVDGLTGIHYRLLAAGGDADRPETMLNKNTLTHSLTHTHTLSLSLYLSLWVCKGMTTAGLGRKDGPIAGRVGHVKCRSRKVIMRF